jgi:hypothetical protein
VAQDEESRSNDAIFQAERVVLDQLFECYPAHLSKTELCGLARSSRINDGHVEDALSELLSQGLIHRQTDADFYWLTRPVICIAELGWSATSL